MDLLWRKPRHEFETLVQARILGRGFGQHVGRDESEVDLERVETREVARAGVAQDGQDVQVAFREEARHVGREHCLGAGDGTRDQTEESFPGLALRFPLGTLDRSARKERRENESGNANRTQHTFPRFTRNYARREKKVPEAKSHFAWRPRRRRFPSAGGGRKSMRSYALREGAPKPGQNDFSCCGGG